MKQANKWRATAFAKMADALSDKDARFGVLTFGELVQFCKPGPKKLAGFAKGAVQHAKEFFDTGTSPELMVGGDGGGKGGGGGTSGGAE